MTGSPRTSTGAPPRLLLVTRRFVPYADQTSYRWLRFCDGLVRRGWEVEVLTATPQWTEVLYDEGLLRLLPPSVVVHHVDPGPIEKRVLRARRERAVAAAPAGAAPGPSGATREPRGAVVRGLLRRAYEVLTPMVSPDLTVEWVPWAVPAGRRLLRERRFDVVVSASSPFSSHVAARHITRGSGVPWIGDFSDPLADNVFLQRPAWRAGIDRRFERGWLETMDGVVVPVQEMADLFRRRYPRLRAERIDVVPYGYPEELYETIEPWPLEGFSIVHTGVFYSGPRDPMPMFRALTRLRDLPVCLHHAGSMSPDYLRFLEQQGVAHLFRDHGFQPRPAVVGMQKGAVCLLAVGNQGGLQLPGKLLDYIGARRPILMLKNDAHDIAADLVASTRTGLVVDNEPEAIAAGIRRLHDAWRAGTLDSGFELGRGAEFAWGRQEERIAERLAAHVARARDRR